MAPAPRRQSPQQCGSTSRPGCWGWVNSEFDIGFYARLCYRQSMSTIRKIRRSSVDPVAGGFYTVQEASRLLRISNPTRVKDWLQGRKNSRLGPVLLRQYQPVGLLQELGFWDLIEVRFVDHFRSHGVSLQALRKAAETAREIWKQQHPFATSKAKYLTDRKTIFQETAEQTNDKVLLDLVTRQYSMYVFFEDFLNRGLDFDPATGLAREWRPSLKEFPHIVISPQISYGQPVVTPSNVPTSKIFETWKAEDGSYAAVMDWYEIDEAAAREAIEFQIGLIN
jgi:uncharacterized protein (DUF433 family)